MGLDCWIVGFTDRPLRNLVRVAGTVLRVARPLSCLVRASPNVSAMREQSSCVEDFGKGATGYLGGQRRSEKKFLPLHKGKCQEAETFGGKWLLEKELQNL